MLKLEALAKHYGDQPVFEALDAGDLAPLRERGIAATRQLAKRQLTWLRSLPQRHVVACDEGEPVQAVQLRLQRLLQE
jgi:tRNA dimethylallyltransferase